MTAEGREQTAAMTGQTVTVRVDDLLACVEEACAHLAYWGEPDPAWLDRIRAALSDEQTSENSRST